MEALVARMMACPKCGVILNPANHGNLVFDGQVWCDRCHEYGRELIRPRDLREIQAWSRMICRALGFPPVLLEENADPAVFRKDASVLMAEADHRRRSIRLYSPGCRLATLCHELAHIYTGQDHSRDWALMFAKLVAWVKTRLAEDNGPQGFRARSSIYAGVPRRVY
jgi:ribosomal protein S27AE